jgi:hypothetical protein
MVYELRKNLGGGLRWLAGRVEVFHAQPPGKPMGLGIQEARQGRY